MKIALALYVTLWSAKGAFADFDCNQCFDNGGKMCLSKDDYTVGTCCDPNNGECDALSERPEYQGSIFCTTKDRIENDYMRRFACPAVRNRCPNTQDHIAITLREENQ